MHQPQCVKGLLARPIPIIRAFLLCLLLLCSQLPSVVGFFSYAEAADYIHGGAHPLLVRSTASAHVGSSTLAQTHKASKFANVHVDHRKTVSPHTAVADPTGNAAAVTKSITTHGNSVKAKLSAIATGSSTYTVGQTVTYTLNAQIAANSASIPAGTPVTMEDVLPVGLTGVTASAPNGGWSFNSYAAVSPSDIIATYTGMSSLNAGATLPTIRITATIQPGITQTFTNTALLSISGNTGTSSSTSTISISRANKANPVTHVTNGTTTLSITPVGGSTYTAGQSVTYNLSANIGAQLPVGSTIVVTGSIPQAGLSNISASSSTPATLGSWRFSIPNTTSPATVTGTFVSTTTIPAGTKLSFTITGKTNASVAPTFTTNATLSLNGTTSSSSSRAITRSNAATAGNPSGSGCASCASGSSCADISVCSACTNIAGCSNASGSITTTSNTTTTTTTGNTACADISVCSACTNIAGCSNASGSINTTTGTTNITTGTTSTNTTTGTTNTTTGTTSTNTTTGTTNTTTGTTTNTTTGTTSPNTTTGTTNTTGGISTIGNTGNSGGSSPVGSSGGSVGLGIPTNAVSLDQTTVRGDSYHVGDVVVFVLTPYIESNPSDIDNPGAIQLNDVVPVGATDIRVWGKCWQVEQYDKAGPTLITASLTCPDSLTAGPKLPELRISLRLNGNDFPTRHDANSCKAASAFTNTAEVNVEGGNASRNNISAYTVKVMRLCHPYGHGNSYGHGKVNGYPGGAGSSAPAGGQGPQTSLPALPLTGYDPKER